MKSFLGVPITIRGEAFGNLYLTEKVGGGGEFDDLDERSVVVLADWAAVAIENARLYQSEHRRKLELERAVSGLEATTAIARALGGETDVDKVLDLIVKRGRALVEARWAAVKIVDGEELVVRAFAGQLGQDPSGWRFPIEVGLGGQRLSEARPQRIADVRTHQRAGGG